MTTGLGYSSPYSRMDTLANEVCSKMLRKSKLEPAIEQLYPDGKIPKYSMLFEAILTLVKTEMHRAFSQDECLKQLQSEMLQSQTVTKCAESYAARPQSMRWIEESLQKLGYAEPPCDTSQHEWCILF